MTGDTFPWLALALLGASHGINPGMGWLFAVALGMQEQKAKAVWRALLPLAAGHALAVGMVVLVAALVGQAVPPSVLKWGVAVTLIGFGAFRILRNAHPRYGRMQVSLRQLTIWSFLMATAHGAGLMVLPVLLKHDAPAAEARVAALETDAQNITTYVPARAAADAHTSHSGHVGSAQHDGPGGLLATLIHTAAYLLLTGLIAVCVYRWLGLRWIRAAWVNLDLIWGCALMLTGVLTAVTR